MATFLRDGKIKTRKSHRCHGCQKKIPKGTMLYSQTGIDDGFYTVYMCDDCLDWCKNRSCKECLECENAFEGYVQECRLSQNYT